jgi:hypothetical protein
MSMEYGYSMHALALAVTRANRIADITGETYLILKQKIGGYRGNDLAYYGPMTEREQQSKYAQGSVLYTATPCQEDHSFELLARYRVIARLFEQEWGDGWRCYFP